MRMTNLFFSLIVSTLLWSSVAQAKTCHQNHTAWSNTKPAVNVGHVITGEINKNGKAVGFHSRSGGHDPAGANMIKVLKGPNAKGIYTGQVTLCNGAGWTAKNGFSSFFPDSWTQDQVVQKIIEAHAAAGSPKTGKFSGKVDGITIEGYMCNEGQANCPKGNINTAYPLFL